MCHRGRAARTVPRGPVDPAPFRDHPGEEFIFVHEGQAELILPSRTIALDPGDCAYFKATTPQKLRSLGTRRAAVLLLVSSDYDTPDGARPPHSRLP
ncbi:cupin domain-containing protein [Streptomyces noursei]|uniref:cupin domain-containing protein n=1 Tax=Streptomyces noursei TaxID=1971 RepID=UPI0019622D96|nr:cupin domain-containing protein [Streptomyces noursei]QRX95045.1 cupin domain-containing protein [Streptomyces noursei]